MLKISRSISLSCIVGAGILAAWSQVSAESLPAVSAVNGKFDIRGGSISDSAGGLATGALSLPLDQRFGVQFDGAAGMVDGDAVAGGAAHLFWRDPSEGLLGFYGSYAYRDARSGIDMQRFAVEGERYIGRVNLSGLAGYETGDAGGSVFTIADLGYYPEDDLRLYAGHRYGGIGHTGVLGAEWQVPSEMDTGISVFAEADKAEDGRHSALVGLRFYFGAEKTLIRRHREDDPIVRSNDEIAALAGCTDIPTCRNAPGGTTSTTSTTSSTSTSSSGL